MSLWLPMVWEKNLSPWTWHSRFHCLASACASLWECPKAAQTDKYREVKQLPEVTRPGSACGGI